MQIRRREGNSSVADAQIQRLHEQNRQAAARDQERHRQGRPARLHLHRSVQTNARQSGHRRDQQP